MQRLYGRLLGGFLRLFFDLLYHQFAWSYDLVAAVVSVGMWKDWVLSVLPELNGERVLEVGHGPGHLQGAMLSKGTLTVGLDKSKWMGRQAKRRLVKQGLRPRLINGVTQALPLPSDSFDQVVATFPSEYITEAQSLAEIRRVLRPGGELLVLPVAWVKGSGWIYRAAAWLFRVTGQAGEWSDHFLRPFREAGFEVESERKKLARSEVIIIHATLPK